ncbi:DUF2789 family protein [Planctobacterium marinum]|uniref:DUF2789 domain-containing protein n=1 Tax=Planctobacterium marinum TaxID=1631968 RepID=A0AA48HUX3_9ALTE|nr:hypothetical protein MACH26_18490 [Planctobacterium marinum]
MLNTTPTLKDLFSQLGLDSSDEGMDYFIYQNNGLPEEVHIEDAEFWTDSQRAFIKSELEDDAEWCELIDQLNAMLH